MREVCKPEMADEALQMVRDRPTVSPTLAIFASFYSPRPPDRPPRPAPDADFSPHRNTRVVRRWYHRPRRDHRRDHLLVTHLPTRPSPVAFFHTR